ncbi:classical arabinogalactan protein 5-like [Zingiber officinale]|uniref:classical arabinogalactan protein 5-like n=1 Tax=Zingiber officinale TaxID=94328 RepID=UPI001C4B0807|nr:classical arabinogalactan protein 5-like [Zingiber officinale]
MPHCLRAVYGMELFASVGCLLFLLFQASRAMDFPELPAFPAPAPTSGADFVVSPTSRTPPASGPAPAPLVDSRPLEPKEKSAPASSIPFISSSPAVPLPVGETDTATILPSPTRGSDNRAVGASSSCDAVRVSSLLIVLASALLSIRAVSFL